MNESLERRLATHLGEQAEQLDPNDHGVEYVMSEGRRMRTGRAMVMGAAASLAVVGLAVAAIAVSGAKSKEAAIQPPAAGRPLTLGLPNATESAANFAWSVENGSSEANQLGAMPWWSGAASNGESAYTFGTVPHGPDDPIQQQLFATADGVEYQAAGVPFDPWISDLDSSQPDRVYAIGTVPSDFAYSYQAGVSDDGGATWQESDLPLGLDTVREDLGGLRETGAQIVAGGDNTVAIVQTIAFTQTLAIDGVDTQYGTNVTANGVEVYAAPTDLQAISARECPPEWPLTKGPPREAPSDDTGTGPATTSFGPVGEPGNGANQWHCQSPDSNGPDLWIDPARVHGDVAHVVPFEQLGLDDASVKALRMAVRVFHSTDGQSWSEVDIPAGGSSAFMPSVFWTGSQFVLRAPGADGGQLWLSVDGLSWQQGTLPHGSDSMALGSLPDGSLLLAGQTGGELASYTSIDGLTWSGVSLAALIGLDASWRTSQLQMITSTSGASLMVGASADVVATLGPPVIDHGRFQLRLTDSQGGVELLDGSGNVLDRIDSVWRAASTGINGQLVTTGSGNVAAVDTSTGAVLDVFTLSEIQLATDEVMSTDAGQQFQNRVAPSAWWVLDTIDGTTWGITQIDGISAANTWPSAAAQATENTHAYRLAVNQSTAVVVGRRTS